MSIITFDTLKFVETLKASGFDEKQAKAVSTAFSDTQEVQLDSLSTKRDLKELELVMKHDIKELELSVNFKIEQLRNDMVRWQIGISVATIGILFALLRITTS
jgi:hypothetical protein